MRPWTESTTSGTPLGAWVTKLEANRPDPSPEITAKAQELIAGAPDFYTKLSSITEYIQKNIRYFIVMRGIGGLQANHAADIFRNRYGDCKDKTTLLISMLQVAGIQAFYVPVDDRRGVVDPDAPSLYGNHMITAIEIPADVNDPAPAGGREGEGRQALPDLRPHQRAHSGGQSAFLRAGQLRHSGGGRRTARSSRCRCCPGRERNRCERAPSRSLPTAL